VSFLLRIKWKWSWKLDKLTEKELINEFNTTTFHPLDKWIYPKAGEPSVAIKGTVEYPDNNPKTVLGLKKPSLSAIPPAGMFHLGLAMDNGRNKYGAMNWREKKVSSSIYYDAALRHLLSWYDGEDYAEDSGVHHLGHAMACLSIVLDAMETGNLNDDRPHMGVYSKLVDNYVKDKS